MNLFTLHYLRSENTAFVVVVVVVVLTSCNFLQINALNGNMSICN